MQCVEGFCQCRSSHHLPRTEQSSLSTFSFSNRDLKGVTLAKYATFLELPAGMHSQDNTVILKYLRKNSSNRSASSTSSNTSAAGSKSSSANNSAHIMFAGGGVGVRDGLNAGAVVSAGAAADPVVDATPEAPETVTSGSEAGGNNAGADDNTTTAVNPAEEKEEPAAAGGSTNLETIREDGESEQVVASEDAPDNSI